MKIEESIEINQPLETVYEFFANVNNLPKCSGAIAEVRGAPDRAVEVGDTYTSVARVMGTEIETAHRVLRVEPSQELEIEGTTGRTRILVHMTFEATESGTRVIQRGEGEPGGALRLAGPMLARTMKKQVRDDLNNVKKVLEAG